MDMRLFLFPCLMAGVFVFIFYSPYVRMMKNTSIIICTKLGV